LLLLLLVQAKISAKNTGVFYSRVDERRLVICTSAHGRSCGEKGDQSDKAHERLFFIYFYPPWFYCTWVTPMPIFYSSSSSLKKKKKVDLM